MAGVGEVHGRMITAQMSHHSEPELWEIDKLPGGGTLILKEKTFESIHLSAYNIRGTELRSEATRVNKTKSSSLGSFQFAGHFRQDNR